jgi:hypothetical protein
MKKFILQTKETGAFIDEFTSIIDAQEELKDYEKCDKSEGNYTTEFYEIVEKEIN